MNYIVPIIGFVLFGLIPWCVGVYKVSTWFADLMVDLLFDSKTCKPKFFNYDRNI